MEGRRRSDRNRLVAAGWFPGSFALGDSRAARRIGTRGRLAHRFASPRRNRAARRLGKRRGCVAAHARGQTTIRSEEHSESRTFRGWNLMTDPTTSAHPTAFDAHHPPSDKIIDTCVHCGFCLPACPTDVLWGQEMDSPRGRIYLMKLASEGAAAINPRWVSHFDSCLGCMACMPACPSGVDYGQLIEAT